MAAYPTPQDWTQVPTEFGMGWTDQYGNLTWDQPAGWAPPAPVEQPWSPYTPSGNDQGGYVDPHGNTVYDPQAGVYGALTPDQFAQFHQPYANTPGVLAPEEFLQAGWTPEAYARGMVYAGSDNPIEAGRSFNPMSRSIDILDAFMNQPTLLDARGGQTFDWRNIPQIEQAYDVYGERAKAQAQQAHDVNTNTGGIIGGLGWQELLKGLSVMAPGIMAIAAPAVAAGSLGAGLAAAETGTMSLAPFATRALGIIDPRLGQIAGLANSGVGMFGVGVAPEQIGMDDLWGGDLDVGNNMPTAPQWGMDELWGPDLDVGNNMPTAPQWGMDELWGPDLGGSAPSVPQIGMDALWGPDLDVGSNVAPAPQVAAAAPAAPATESKPENQPLTEGGVTAGDLFKYAKLAYGLYQQLSGGGGGDVARRTQAVVDKQYANEQERSAAYSAYAQELLGFIPSVSEAYAMDPQNVRTAFGDTFIDPNTGEVRYQLTPGTQEFYDALMQNANDTLSQALGTDVDALTEKEFNKAIEQLQGKRDKDLAAITRALYARGLLGLMSYQGSGKNLLTGETESWQLAEGQGANPYFAAYEAQIARENAELAKQSRDDADNYVQELLNHSGGLLGQAQDIDEGMLSALFNAGEYTDEFGEVKQRRARGLYDLIAGPDGAFLSQLTGMLPTGKAAAALVGQQSAEDIRRNAILRGIFEE
jgi:hypothetical protein